MKVHKKKAFLNSLKLANGIISMAADSVGITRKTYYNWLEKDPKFKENVDEVMESVIDKVEGKLLTRINDDDTTAIIFYLKTKGKKRGYIETVENNVTVNPFLELMKQATSDD